MPFRNLSIEFAVIILNLVTDLKHQRETIVSNQIGRTGTSIGANILGAQYAHGKPDFIAKLQIALENGFYFCFRRNSAFLRRKKVESAGRMRPGITCR